MTLKPFGNTSQAKTIKISSPNPTLAKRRGWGMRFGFLQLARTCDALAFMPFADGMVSAGVAMEADAMRASGKKLF